MNNPTHRPARSFSESLPILDRSRSRLRIPVDLLPEALRQAGDEGLASPVAAVRMESGRILADGVLDPVATAMLNVIAAASLVVAVDVELGDHSSVTTVWATPHRAVITSSLDPNLVDIEPVRLTRLPETLSDIILLRPPQAPAEHPISLPTSTAERLPELSRADARTELEEVDLAADDIDRVIAFHAPGTRRWRISSTWATDHGQQMAELQGLDAGPKGQWLVAANDGSDETVFTPQTDGDTLRALREVLPRRWVGTALNPRRSG